jgi:hypothetical protein
LFRKHPGGLRLIVSPGTDDVRNPLDGRIRMGLNVFQNAVCFFTVRGIQVLENRRRKVLGFILWTGGKTRTGVHTAP